MVLGEIRIGKVPRSSKLVSSLSILVRLQYMVPVPLQPGSYSSPPVGLTHSLIFVALLFLHGLMVKQTVAYN
jgi:hypothetical protein